MDTDNFLTQLYDTRLGPAITAAHAARAGSVNWVRKTHYENSESFLKLFDNINQYESHKDFGNGTLYYNKEMTYPTQVDPNFEFQSFVKRSVQGLPITNLQFKKSWWLNYPVGAYSGLHSHIPGPQLTAVLFLTTCKTTQEYPLAGSLNTLAIAGDKIDYTQHHCVAGDVIIMDGNVYHGTYPTLNERKVFVCDFSYEVLQPGEEE